MQNSNALLQNQGEVKKRIGKKEKRKYATYALLIIVLIFGVFKFIDAQKQAKLRAEEEARKGSLTTIDAEKARYDDDGNLIEETSDTRVLTFADGSILLKKDSFEVLIDPGADAKDNIDGYINGNIETLITTSPKNKNINKIKKEYNIDQIILAKESNKKNGKIKDRIIDMGENLSVYVKNNNAARESNRNSVLVYDGAAKVNFAVLNDISDKSFDLLGEDYKCSAIIIKGNAGKLSSSTIKNRFPKTVVLMNKIEGNSLNMLKEQSLGIYPIYSLKKQEFIVKEGSLTEASQNN